MANGYRGVSPENYLITGKRMVTTVLAPNKQEWQALGDAAQGFSDVEVEPLQAITPSEVQEAADAYYQALLGQVADRQQTISVDAEGREIKHSIPIDRQVVGAAVGRALSDGGRVARLTLTSPYNNIMGVAGKFAWAWAAKSRHRQANGAHRHSRLL